MRKKKSSRRTFRSAISLNKGITTFEVGRTKGLKNRILTLAGQFKKPLEISAILKEEFPDFYKRAQDTIGVLINNTIYKNKNCVNAFKEQYIKEIMEVPGAHKRVRLERLETIYDEEKKNSEKREIIKAMREEMEGARVNLNLYQLNIFGGLSDEELARREKEIIERIRADSGGEVKTPENAGVSVLSTPLQTETVSSV